MLVVLVGATASAQAPPSLVHDRAAFDVSSGMYGNRVPNIDHPFDYVEVCFVNGAELTDIHVGGGPSAGGNCVPSSVGFVIELVPRTVERWANARATCTAEGMRLPEPFELLYACNNAVAIGFTSVTQVTGWMSNSFSFEPTIGLVTYTLNSPGSCTDAGRTATITASSVQFLCVR